MPRSSSAATESPSRPDPGGDPDLPEIGFEKFALRATQEEAVSRGIRVAVRQVMKIRNIRRDDEGVRTADDADDRHRLPVAHLLHVDVQDRRPGRRLQRQDAAPRPPRACPIRTPLPPIKIRITAAENGRIAGIKFADVARSKTSTSCGSRSARSWATPPARCPRDTEIEFDCDYNLRYEYVIQAMTAVSGYIRDGQVVKLVEKIKFTPPQVALDPRIVHISTRYVTPSLKRSSSHARGWNFLWTAFSRDMSTCV